MSYVCLDDCFGHSKRRHFIVSRPPPSVSEGAACFLYYCRVTQKCIITVTENCALVSQTNKKLMHINSVLAHV